MEALSLRLPLLSVVAAGAVAALPIVAVVAIRAPSPVEAVAPPSPDTPALAPRGFRLESVPPGSFAARLGLKSGDVVVSVDGAPFAGPEAILQDSGGELVIDIIRNGQHGTLHHTL